MSDPISIGEVSWRDGKLEATLHSDRAWRSDEAGLANTLALLYPATSAKWWGPSAGRPGVRVLEDAATMFGGGLVEIFGGVQEGEGEGEVY